MVSFQEKSALAKAKPDSRAKRLFKLAANQAPAWVVNAGYEYYSKVYQGQLRLGLPVSRELIISQKEIENSAAAKLALTLYHIFLRTTGTRIPRLEIKNTILDELSSGRMKLTENVIVLARDQLEYLAGQRFKIAEKHLPAVTNEARRRRILKEALAYDRAPAYFESEVEERGENGRGDYEMVYYRDYTSEGKEIRFRRLVSMEDVTAGDDRPSVVLVPGFANNANCFNVTNDHSLAKDLADLGYWTYLFDPRGMGINEGKFDPYYTVDTLIDHDLPSVVRFIYHRSKGKPSILVGHSMGGIISENMALMWNLRKQLNDLPGLSDEKREAIDRILPPMDEAAKSLPMVRGIVSLGSPKYFEKLSHVIFPVMLWLNHVARIFKFRYVPVREFFWFLTQPPFVKRLGLNLLNTNFADLNFLCCPENHDDWKGFVREYVHHCLESVPIGLGFQFLKAIYNGEGFKRMDDTRLNYSEYLRYFPENIPVFHFFGTADPLCPHTNQRYSEYYPHRRKRVYEITTPRDLKKIEITGEPDQAVDFIIHGANHLDLLYGTVNTEIVQPLLRRIVHQVWGDWTYADSLLMETAGPGKKNGKKTGGKVRALKEVK
ncbi:MAG: alpha/beta fold hydrolase [Deltaproteobacteria bacterium]|nr:alpha/beta fold hydrolase [Deltaproteobacteria bacterium]